MAQSEAEKRLADGSAWRDFCRSLEQAGEAIFREGTPRDSLHRAEGLRYLTRLLRAGLESHVESCDPRYPRFFQLSNETLKIGNDNPDNVYHNANVSGAYEYRIRGHRGSVPYLSFGTKAGGYESDATMIPTGQLDLAQMQVDPDGRFEILVSRREHPGNWLPMAAETVGMVVRQTFDDREREQPATYSIACLNPDAPDTLQPEYLEPALQRASAFVRNTSALFVGWMQDFSEHANQLPPNDQALCQRVGGDANIHYHNSYWHLDDGQALLIEFSPPECTTWNFQLSNYWMESLDYRYHRIHVNKHSAAYQSDGSVRLVVAHSDPGRGWPNWLDTCAHREGAMLLRYVGATSHPPVATRVLPFEELEP